MPVISGKPDINNINNINNKTVYWTVVYMIRIAENNTIITNGFIFPQV